VGQWLTGWDIGAMSLLAFFSLSGIVINDSIVLISFLRRDVDAGMPVKEALLQAVRARFRAVILTSLTTVAGLAPLMFENSSLAMYVAPIAYRMFWSEFGYGSCADCYSGVDPVVRRRRR
ncbi:MAG: hypothetical protein GWP50_09205, partial [Proteobacteria bacterium]|nr:hypothetical protein [Pseudomonadota bacterium]